LYLTPCNSEDYNIILIDDCTYTGKNLLHIIRSFTHTFPSDTFNFIVINTEQMILKEITINFIPFVELYRDYFTTITSKECSNNIYNGLLEIISPDIINIPLIYFDHKVHDTLTTSFRDACIPRTSRTK